ncbi:hypothetical protein ACH5RR_034741, partial [Cinchona calisaya]
MRGTINIIGSSTRSSICFSIRSGNLMIVLILTKASEIQEESLQQKDDSGKCFKNMPSTREGTPVNKQDSIAYGYVPNMNSNKGKGKENPLTDRQDPSAAVINALLAFPNSGIELSGKVFCEAKGNSSILTGNYCYTQKLADYVGLPCRIARGCMYCVADHRSSCLVKVGDDRKFSREFIVDLVGEPGNVRGADSSINE